MNDLISVIVPLYNAEKYIDTIIPCLQNQTYRNLEIVLVNDGSTDTTLDKILKYQEHDKRLKVITQPNQGVAAARNNGLNNAAGLYIAFIDADDLVACNYIEKMYEYALAENCDIVCCGCIQTEGSYSLTPMGEYPTVKKNRIIDNKIDVLQDYALNDEQYGCVVWAKLIKRTIAAMVKFEQLKYGEDQQYMMRLFRSANRIGLIDFKGYYYIRWDASATVRMPQTNIGRLNDGIAVAKTYMDMCEESKNEKLICTAQKRYGNAVTMALHCSVLLSKNEYNEWRKHLKDCASKVLHLSECSFYKKADVAMYHCLGEFYYWIVKSIKILIRRVHR